MEDAHKDEVIVFVNRQSSMQFMNEESQERRIATYVQVETLQTNIIHFLGKMDSVVRSSPDTIGEFDLDRIEIHAETNGEGQVGLLGTGVSVGATAGITFVLSRRRI